MLGWNASLFLRKLLEGAIGRKAARWTCSMFFFCLALFKSSAGSMDWVFSQKAVPHETGLNHHPSRSRLGNSPTTKTAPKGPTEAISFVRNSSVWTYLKDPKILVLSLPEWSLSWWKCVRCLHQGRGSKWPERKGENIWDLVDLQSIAPWFGLVSCDVFLLCLEWVFMDSAFLLGRWVSNLQKMNHMLNKWGNITNRAIFVYCHYVYLRITYCNLPEQIG